MAISHSNEVPAIRVLQSKSGWRVVAGGKVVGDGMTNADAWRLADRQTDVDQLIDDPGRRIDHRVWQR